MRQLGAHDAAFLYADSVHANANVTLLHIYDQSTAPGGKVRFKSILAHIEQRQPRLPLFRQRLQRVPFDIDFPYWVDDENFDLEYHVRHIALPEPGDWRQFCIQAARIHSRPLDLARPLWEVYVIEGLNSFADLPAGSFALLVKTHHAAIDLEHGSEVTLLLHDVAGSPQRPAPPPPWFPERTPGRAWLAARGMLRSFTAPARLAGPLGRVLRHAGPLALAAAAGLRPPPRTMPATRFNAVVSPHRVFETRRFAVAEFESIRARVAGATVHDAVLAVCGGALRRYLERHDENPAGSLWALTPSAAAAGAAVEGEAAWLPVRLGTDIADPLARLVAVAAQTHAPSVAERARDTREIGELGRQAPALTVALSAKLLGRATSVGAGRRRALANCTVTHVPGPPAPLVLCGARMTYFSAIMPIADGMGLVFAVTEYDGRIVVSPTSCRELMPDPAAFAQDLRDSFQESLAAARRTEPPPAGPDAAPTGRSAQPARRHSGAAAATAQSRRAPAPGRRRPAIPSA